MAFYSILRPKLCQIVTTVKFSPCFQRTCIPFTCSIVDLKGDHVGAALQSRGYRKKIDVSHLKPLNFDYSEDLVKQEPFDPSEIMFKYRDVPEIKELPDHVKKLFTLDYATSQERLEHRNAVLLEKVTDLVGPGPCLEKEICYLTIKIRNLIPYIVGDRRNKRHKSYLIERIAKRKKLLKFLRKLDYDRFLWLLKELKVTWTPDDPYRYFNKLSKKAILKKEAREEMLSEKRKKVENIRAELETEKEKFYKMKEKVLQEIDNDIKEYGLNKVEILKSFQDHMIEQQKKNIEGAKKLNKLQRTINEQKEQKERDSRIF
ncbi:28S ribosomal protein S15, mitochondrial-like [Mercenaria mercenaria]|uniref:28S ribosomal protein S15, mitochondrial-like n=1 Tax=Mercenaria mercenaria TaxID=6596 RepID=UPI001E1E130B|nr:28S ribosomal protein S15, mitochondrial-like [Mercenaria mercenaria]